MSWKNRLQPNLLLSDTILSLTPEMLVANGIQGVVLDVDETLIPFTMAQVSAELLIWVESIRAVVPQIWLASNNVSENRIQRVAEALQVPYVTAAGKPSRRKLRRVVEAMKLPPEQVAMVGDRLFTDVLAGNRLGMFTVIVKPMVDPAEGKKHYPIHNLEFRISRALGTAVPMPDWV